MFLYWCGLFMLFTGACAKSAQIGYILDYLMHGRTYTVSALYMLLLWLQQEFFLLLDIYDVWILFDVLNIASYLGSLLAYVLHLSVLPNGCKKVVAYSTNSHLGLMVLACVSVFFSSVYFIWYYMRVKNYIIFRLCAVIHALGDEQDIRRIRV